MREQLQQYVTLLFAGAQDCEEIQQEILQNTLDRYDDLIAQGKVPEAAYRLAISGIGDIHEIWGTPSQPKTAVPSTTPSVQPEEEEDPSRKKLLRAIAVGLYIFSLVPLILFSSAGGGTTGFCLLLAIVAVATVLMILGAKPKTAAASTAQSKIQKHSAKNSKFRKWLPMGIAGMVCIILVTVLLLILVGSVTNKQYNIVEATMTPYTVENLSKTVTLGKKAAIYTSPSREAGINGQLEAGTEITIQRQENVGNMLWAYIDAPIQGWMVLEDHKPDAVPDSATESPKQETVFFSEAVTIYSSPSIERGSIQGELEAGTAIDITRQELINGKKWSYTVSPIQGWILMDGLAIADVTATEFIAPAENTDPASQNISGSSMEAKDISSISIDWIAGNIHIVAGEDNRIHIEETEGDQLLVWKQKNGKLSIAFCEKSLMTGLHADNVKAKDLTITVPKNWVCLEMEIDAAASNLVLQDLMTQTVEIDVTSGRTEFVNCDLSSLDIETASGDISFTGYLDVLECESVSGNFIGTLNNAPRSIEMESDSGSLDLTIPDGTGFIVRLDGIKNIFSAQDFQIKMQNDAYVHGDGACQIEMESASGGVYLQKAK